MYLNTLSGSQVSGVKEQVQKVVDAYNKYPQSLVEEDKGIPMPEIIMSDNVDAMEYREGTIRVENKEISDNFLVNYLLFDNIRKDLQDICSGKKVCEKYYWSNKYGLAVEQGENYNDVTIRFYDLIE